MSNFERGTYKVIRTDGAEEVFSAKPSITSIHRVIGCKTLDTVSIGKNPANGPADLVMLLDDIGSGFIGKTRVCETKPVNEKATALYHSVCHPGTTTRIYGDVAICYDEDFA